MKLPRSIFPRQPARGHWLLAICFLVCAGSAPAQIAADSAQNYPATAGSGIWNDGDNFGFGFQPWQFSSTVGNAGIVIGDSMQNGGPLQPDGTQSKGINSPNGRSWGLFANSGGSAEVVRPFVAPLSIGDTFSVDWDTGFIDNGGNDGIRLSDSNGNVTLWELVFTGGTNIYQVHDLDGFGDTSLPFTDDGLHIDFTLTSTTTYSVKITEADGPTQTITGSLLNSGAVSQFGFFDHNAGFDNTHNVYANNLVIVPEPAPLALLIVSTVIAIGFATLRNASPARTVGGARLRRAA